MDLYMLWQKDVFSSKAEYVGKWGKSVSVCEVMVVVGEGLISRSDRKCLCRWNSNVDTLRTEYRKQPTLQLCVSICMLVISSSSLLLCSILYIQRRR